MVVFFLSSMFGFLSFPFLQSFVQFKAELCFADTLAKVKRDRHSTVYSLLPSSSSSSSLSSSSALASSSLLPSSGVNPAAVATTFNSIIEGRRRRRGRGQSTVQESPSCFCYYYCTTATHYHYCSYFYTSIIGVHFKEVQASCTTSTKYSLAICCVL